MVFCGGVLGGQQSQQSRSRTSRTHRLSDVGHVLGESMAALITFVAAVLPLGWMLRALWRRKCARRG